MMSGFKLVDYSKGKRPKTEEFPISSEQDIQRILKRFRHQDPKFVALISPTGDSLTIGVAHRLGCVMYTGASGDPPYLWALGNSDDREVCIEFDAGGTLTPVPLFRCLPFDSVVEIVVSYFLNGELPQSVEWDED
jgi:hypothetical protein